MRVGLSLSRGVHRDAGASSGDRRRPLADDVGTQLDDHRHANQATRNGTSKSNNVTLSFRFVLFIHGKLCGHSSHLFASVDDDLFSLRLSVSWKEALSVE